MKFVVTKAPYNDSQVEVRLHEDTKYKIKKILAWVPAIVGLCAIIAMKAADRKNDKQSTTTE